MNMLLIKDVFLPFVIHGYIQGIEKFNNFFKLAMQAGYDSYISRGLPLVYEPLDFSCYPVIFMRSSGESPAYYVSPFKLFIRRYDSFINTRDEILEARLTLEDNVSCQ